MLEQNSQGRTGAERTTDRAEQVWQATQGYLAYQTYQGLQRGVRGGIQGAVRPNRAAPAKHGAKWPEIVVDNEGRLWYDS